MSQNTKTVNIAEKISSEMLSMKEQYPNRRVELDIGNLYYIKCIKGECDSYNSIIVKYR